MLSVLPKGTQLLIDNAIQTQKVRLKRPFS